MACDARDRLPETYGRKAWAKYVAACVVATAVLALSFVYAGKSEALVRIYADKLQDPIISSFVTLAGLLYSLKTFVVVNIKENLYDAQAYAKARKDAEALLPNGATLRHRYQPLVSLSEHLFFTIYVVFLAALTNGTVGLIENVWCSATAVGTAVGAALAFSFSVFKLHKNFRQWHKLLLDTADEAGASPPSGALSASYQSGTGEAQRG